MKYYIIICMFIFLFLNACSLDFDTKHKDIKSPSNKKSKPSTEEGPSREELKPGTEEDLNKEIKNKLLNGLKNLIETANAHKEKYIKIMEEEPSDQYGMPFNGLNWGPGTEDISSNTVRSINYRRYTYTLLSAIDTKELKEFANILTLATAYSMYNLFSSLGVDLDIVTNRLYPKKDTLDKLDTSDLQKLKNSLEKILSIIKNISEMSKQLLLDYQNDTNLIKTDVNKLKSHVSALYNQFKEKAEESDKLQKTVISLIKTL
ncbi:virulence associated lipoprotein [Borreliella afzelii]|uniref:virulence associated lipoprotein n=1 Tax=Borreliella afzelii TaxID=29518 RepID=UPI003AF58812